MRKFKSRFTASEMLRAADYLHKRYPDLAISAEVSVWARTTCDTQASFSLIALKKSVQGEIPAVVTSVGRKFTSESLNSLEAAVDAMEKALAEKGYDGDG